MNKIPPLPWKYRPDEYDDWGTIKSADGLPTVKVCPGRWTKDFDMHRKNNTDPGFDTAAFIVKACNNHAKLRELLEEAAGYLNLNNYTPILVGKINAVLAELEKKP
jgi:hypothetical protein